MARTGRRRAKWAFLLLGLAFAAAAGKAEAATFIPHKAIYGLKLAQERKMTGPVNNARGKLEFEWKDVCDGWSVSQRTHIVVTHGDGSELAFGWTLNAWEAKDGLAYRFFIRRLHGSGEVEEVRGSARLEGPGKGGEASFSLPEARKLPLPKGTIFPTRHSLDVLEALEKKTFPVWRIVFDGSGEEGLFGINAALAQAIPAETAASLDDPLLKPPSWRLLIAYFGMDEEATEPRYEQEMRLFENGVVDELLLDYGDFTLDATLVDLEALPAPGC